MSQLCSEQTFWVKKFVARERVSQSILQRDSHSELVIRRRGLALGKKKKLWRAFMVYFSTHTCRCTLPTPLQASAPFANHFATYTALSTILSQELHNSWPLRRCAIPNLEYRQLSHPSKNPLRYDRAPTFRKSYYEQPDRWADIESRSVGIWADHSNQGDLPGRLFYIASR